jgi:hypothetical protein
MGWLTGMKVWHRPGSGFPQALPVVWCGVGLGARKAQLKGNEPLGSMVETGGDKATHTSESELPGSDTEKQPHCDQQPCPDLLPEATAWCPGWAICAAQPQKSLMGHQWFLAENGPSGDHRSP